MVNVRFHHEDGGLGPNGPGAARVEGSEGSSAGGRLNLLLSHAGWEPDCWVDRLPRLLEPMGVASHRAHSGEEASKVIRTHVIHMAVVDLGLPLSAEREADDEGGERVLELLSRSSHPPPVVVVRRARTHRDASREMSAALRVGAFAVIDRPRDASDMEMVLEVLRRCLHRYYHGRWPGI